jgi:hypothetical protein
MLIDVCQGMLDVGTHIKNVNVNSIPGMFSYPLQILKCPQFVSRIDCILHSEIEFHFIF